MILLFLPLFSKVIYPLFEKCGIRMTPLRRMSAGQFITALAFVVSGFLQSSIESGLTPIPSYGDENSMMVVNGVYQSAIEVESQYWSTVDQERLEEGVTVETRFQLADADSWRTPTHAWINMDLPSNMPVTIGSKTVTLNPQYEDAVTGTGVLVDHEEIKALVYYKDENGEINVRDMNVSNNQVGSCVNLFSTTHRKRNQTV